MAARACDGYFVAAPTAARRRHGVAMCAGISAGFVPGAGGSTPGAIIITVERAREARPLARRLLRHGFTPLYSTLFAVHLEIKRRVLRRLLRPFPRLERDERAFLISYNANALDGAVSIKARLDVFLRDLFRIHASDEERSDARVLRGVNFRLGRSFARFNICSATGSFVPKYLSLMFCFLSSGAALNSGMCVSPLHGRYGQSFLVHAFLNQNVHIGALFLL